MKVVIWCKPVCIFCNLAKEEMDKRGISYEERVLGQGWSREQLLEVAPEAKTVPQIFIGKTLIGGYNEFMSMKTL